MSFGRQKRLLLGWLALLAPLPLPFNGVVGWPVVILYLAGIVFLLRRASLDPPRWLPAWGMNVLGVLYIPIFLVDLLVFEAKARAVFMKAARALAEDDGSCDAIALSASAHAFVCAKAAAAVDECMQLSGGIGFTWEYPSHHELRRVFTNGYLLGTARYSRALFAERSGW